MCLRPWGANHLHFSPALSTGNGVPSILRTPSNVQKWKRFGRTLSSLFVAYHSRLQCVNRKYHKFFEYSSYVLKAWQVVTHFLVFGSRAKRGTTMGINNHASIMKQQFAIQPHNVHETAICHTPSSPETLVKTTICHKPQNSLEIPTLRDG